MTVSTPAITTTASAGFNGDKDDSNLDAELMALAAQQMRPPSVPQPQTTPTQLLKLEQLKPNPAKWTVSLNWSKIHFKTGIDLKKYFILGGGSVGIRTEFDGLHRLCG